MRRSHAPVGAGVAHLGPRHPGHITKKLLMDYTSIDFKTGEIRHENGKFLRWEDVLGEPHAVFKKYRAEEFIPKSWLTQETLDKIDKGVGNV